MLSSQNMSKQDRKEEGKMRGREGSIPDYVIELGSAGGVVVFRG